MMRRGGCLVWGLVVVAAVIVGVVTAALVMFGYFGPPMAEADDVAEWRALGAESWGVDEGETGDWSSVRAVLAKLDEAETAAGAPPVRESASLVRRSIEYDADEADDRALVAIEAMRANGLFELIDGLLAAMPLHDGWGTTPEGEITESMLEATLGDLGGLRSLTRALGREMTEAIDGGDEGRAIAAFDRMMTLSEVLGRQPVLITHLTAIAVRYYGVGLLLEAANRGEVPAGVLEAARERLVTSAMPSAAVVFAGERIAARSSVRASLPGGPLVWVSPAAQFAPMDRYFDDVIAALGHDPRTADGLIGEAWARVEEKPRWMYPMAQVLLPAAGHAATSVFQMETTEAGAVLAFALEEHRLRAGAFPASVDELVGVRLDVVPGDPFNAAGFVYRAGDDATRPAAEGGCVLYSMGLDGEDNGGRVSTGRRSVNPFRRDGAGFDAPVLGPEADDEGDEDEEASG